MPLPGAGDLHQTVQWAEPFGAMDRYGNEQTNWANRFVVRAQIAPKLGGEDVMAARLQGVQPVVIRVRSSVDTRKITTQWRVTDTNSGIQYNVRAVADPFMGMAERGRWIEVLAEAGVAI
jgi:head-tail adaptor